MKGGGLGQEKCCEVPQRILDRAKGLSGGATVSSGGGMSSVFALNRMSSGNHGGAARVLATGQLQELDLRAIRQQVKNSKKKRGGQGRLQYGGELRASEAYELQDQKAEAGHKSSPGACTRW
ncbi:hypothetical protein VE03_10496 [Pseudogymnoascus sp. 23342-1-I1]|nr:hypothetical protein VE03_10496 [Pseudogymnoascus sp. 23342-1-I1]